MMMVCEDDVSNYKQLLKGSTDTYLTLMESKVRSMEITDAGKSDVVRELRKGSRQGK